MHALLQQTLDRFAAATGHRSVAQVLESANKPAKSALITPFRRPKNHPLFHIGVKED